MIIKEICTKGHIGKYNKDGTFKQWKPFCSINEKLNIFERLLYFFKYDQRLYSIGKREDGMLSLQIHLTNSKQKSVSVYFS